MASKFSHLPDISTTQPDRLIKYRVSDDRFSAEVLLPGLSYTDFDQKIGGKISLWSLGKLFEAVRWQGMIHGLFYYPELRKQHAFFVASQSINLSLDSSDIRYRTHFGRKSPIRANLFVSNIGKTSFTIVVDWIDHYSGVKLATNACVAIFVDRRRRKPARFPEKYLPMLDQHLLNVKQQTVKRAVLPSIPNDAFRFEVKSVHSDSDFNNHITQVTYMRWCSDAGAMGALKGHFRKLKRHIELYPLKSTEYHFVSEVLVNDVVVVYVWEVPGSDRNLQFAVAKAGKIMYIQKMEFYDGEPIEVSPHLKTKL